MKLRPYQKEALDRVASGYRQGQFNQLLIAATAAGKTVIFSSIKKHLGLKGPVLILAHLDTLLNQAQRTWEIVNPEDRIGIEQGDRHLGPSQEYDCILASVQTLSGARLKKIQEIPFSLIIVDETHHSMAGSYLSLLKKLGLDPGSRVPGDRRLLVGVTATPDRTDKKDLRTVFPYLAYEYSLWQALEDKTWCPVHCHRVLTGSDLSDVSLRSNGEFVTDELDRIIIDDERTARLIRQWESTGGREGRTVVFCSSREHAQSVAEAFRQVCSNTQYIDGESIDRGAILDQFSSGPSVLVNVRLISEGVDVPGITHVLFASPLSSLIMLTQGIGRGTRRFPGKETLEVIYAVDSVPKAVRLASPASLLGLPGGFDLEGQSLLECRKILEEIIFDSPVSLQALIEAGQVPETLSELRRKIEDLPLYVPTDLSGAVKGHTNLAWVINDLEALMTQDLESAEHYLLRMPAPLRPKGDEPTGPRTIALDSVNGTWHCRIYGPPEHKETIQRQVRKLSEQIDAEMNKFRKFQMIKRRSRLRESERAIPDLLLQDTKLHGDLIKSLERVDRALVRAMPSSLKVIALDAPWRTDDPTPGQMKFAKKLGIPLPEGIRKGDLTLLIDHQLRRKEKL